MEYSEVTDRHTKQMKALINDLGPEVTRELLEEILFLTSPENKERFAYPEIVIKELQEEVADFTSEHFYYYVEKYNAKSKPLYYKIGCYSEQWYNFIHKKIKDPLLWIEEKVRFRYRNLPVAEEEITNEIIEQKRAYKIEKVVIESVHMPCVYILKAKVKGKYMYKIGKTDHLKSRKNALKREYNYDLFLVNALNCENPFEIERKIHTEWFENRRFLKKIDGTLSGEWFILSENELEKLSTTYKMLRL